MFKNLNLGALGHSASFDVACGLARQHGFAGIDLDLGFLGAIAAEKSVNAARDWFAATGLKAGGFGCGAKWREGDSDAAFEESLKAVAADAKLAAALGCTRSMTWVMPASNTLSFKQHWSLVQPRLHRTAQVLADHGCRLGLEFIGPATLRAERKFDFVHSMDAVLALAAACGANVGLLLDAFHMYTAKTSLAELSRVPVEDIVYVHVNDGVAGRGPDEQLDLDRDMVGATGVIDIAGFIATLRAMAYDGPVTVEPFSKAVKAMSASDAAAYTSKSLDKVLA